MKTKSAIVQSFLVASALLSSSITMAAAPLASTKSPGFYGMKVGDFEVTALSDGTFDLPMTKLLINTRPELVKSAIDRDFLTEPVETSNVGYLINTGSKLVLVDTGAGSLFGPTVGRLTSNLVAAGYKPEQVDIILITHMHPDHVGGLYYQDKLVFPNATVYADKADSDYWLSAENTAKAGPDVKAFFQGAQASLNPYIKNKQFKALSGATEIVPGITSLPSHGHTAGHTTYTVESKGQKLALIGDLIHLGSVQFENPSVRIQFDTDPNKAETERRAAFTAAAKQGYLIGASHLPFPGVGHLRSEKTGYRYYPINYTR